MNLGVDHLLHWHLNPTSTRNEKDRGFGLLGNCDNLLHRDKSSTFDTHPNAALPSTKKRRRSEGGASERLRYEEEEVIKIMNCGGGGDGDGGGARWRFSNFYHFHLTPFFSHSHDHKNGRILPCLLPLPLPPSADNTIPLFLSLSSSAVFMAAGRFGKL